MTIRLLIADDHEVVRAGLRTLLQDVADIDIVAEACNGEEALRAAAQSTPDVALVDVVMPGEDGLSTLAKMRSQFPQTRVVIYTGYQNPTFLARAVALGAAAFVHKDTNSEVLLDAIRRAAAGKTTWSRERLRRVSSALAAGPFEVRTEPPLTQRETEVLVKLTEGLTNKQIAQELHISYETVKEHVQHILRKIGVSDRTQAAVWAVRHKLL